MELMDIAWFYHDYIIHDLEIIDLHENQEEIFFFDAFYGYSNPSGMVRIG